VWVNYTLLAGDSHDELQREILDEAAGYLRGPLGRALRLRVAPHLHFAPDEELERSNRLDDLIGQAVRSDRARHVDDPPAAAASGDTDVSDEDAHYDSADDDEADPDEPGARRP
jgi:ribosome-binding factor A